jgi:ketosteroid isomerase-like protein
MNEMLRTLQRGYELMWRENRLEDAVSALDPEFEWVVPGHPDGDVRRGSAGVLEFFRDWKAQFEGMEVDWELREIDAEHALVTFTNRGRGRTSGAPVEMSFGQIWTWRDGRFVRMVLYWNPDEARRAAGLAPPTLTERAHSGLAAYRSGGIEAVLAQLTEDVVWEEDPDWPDREVWHGRDEVRTRFPQRLESTDFDLEIDEVVEGDHRALVLMRWTARGRGSGATADLRVGVIYDFEGELVRRVRFFLDQDRARKAFA